MSLLTNPILAKLLAKENLTVRHGNYNTAWFDVHNRVLGLPIWKDHGKDVYDLLVGHEVGHALFTPSEGWHESNEEIKGCPRSYLNVIEDVRIERKIRETYPGLISPMLRGYKVLVEKEFFGDNTSYNFDQMKLIDKINLKSKLSKTIEVPFNLEEQSLFNRALVAETWSQVVQIVKDILAYSREKQPELMTQKKDTPPSNDIEDNSDETDSESSQQSNTPEEDESGPSGHDDQEQDEAEEEEDSTETDDDSALVADTTGGDFELDEEELSITDEIFRSKEASLLDMGKNGVQDTFINELSKDIRQTCVISYKEIAADRIKVKSEKDNNFYDVEIRADLKMKFNLYYKDVKKSVVPAVKEFEMRKAAYQYQRSTTAKTGSLDVNKVHSYKFNDDLFKKISMQADAKNHGMFLLIDFSGSMYDSITNVLDQVAHLVAFCKSVNIPFEVYGFSSANIESNIWKDNNRPLDGTLDLDDLSLFQLTSSSLKKKDFEESMYALFLRSTFCNRSRSYDYGSLRCTQFSSKLEDFGSTPLHQALIISHYLVKDFILKHNIEKMNFVTLTDGDSNRMRIYRRSRDEADTNYIETTKYAGAAKIVIDKKMVDIPEITRSKGVCKAILLNMKKQLGVNIMGFYIASDARHMTWQAEAAHRDSLVIRTGLTWKPFDRVTMMKEFRQNRCVIMNKTLGYDQYYILRDGKNLETAGDETFSSLTADDSKVKVASEFRKFSKSKKTNKVLMVSIGKAVA